MQKLRESRKQKGLCIYCGNKLDREGIHCTSCNKHIIHGKLNIEQF